MVSKETDSICGPYLTKMAEKEGVIYTLANGDQPRNLIDLVSWVRGLGLEVVAAGKASEYDIIVDPKTWEVEYFSDGPVMTAPELEKYREYKGVETLEGRKRILSSLLYPISADLCEMNLVSNVTGLKPADKELNYPVAKISELADIFIPKEDGGILDKAGVVDVFYDYRYKDEISFGGGEFVIVRANDEETWSLLKGKGHLVSRNGKYGCIYWPYHFLGVETPSSIILMDYLGIGLHTSCRHNSMMIGKTNIPIKKGNILKVEGHHHSIDGVTPQLYSSESVPETAMPFYLLNGATVIEDIPEGKLITAENVELDSTLGRAFVLYSEGLKL